RSSCGSTISLTRLRELLVRCVVRVAAGEWILVSGGRPIHHPLRVMLGFRVTRNDRFTMARAGFFRHLLKRDGGDGAVEPRAVELSPAEAGQLATVFAPPRRLRDLGRTSWLAVGLILLLAGVVWLLGTTQTIVGPLVAAAIVATVAGPIVRRLTVHRIPRAAGAAIVLLPAVALAGLVPVIVIGGVASPAPANVTQTS